MKRIRQQRGFTLIEVMIAMTLFATLAIIAIAALNNASRKNQRVEMDEYLHTEGQNLMQRIMQDVRISAIDYEEYYSREVLQETEYGQNYSSYHQQFFNPGSDGAYGGKCTDGSEYIPETSTCTPDLGTFDTETGSNPFLGSGYDASEANALCNRAISAGTGWACSETDRYHQVEELYLINMAGDTRHYYALEKGAVPAVALVELDGTDEDGDGLIDQWACDKAYTCNNRDSVGNAIPDPGDLTIPNDRDDEDFFPISPKSLYIEELTFYLAPLEDPFHGYTETDTTSGLFQSIQIQPRVTIVLTVRYQLYDKDGSPIDFEDAGLFIGDAPTLTLQTTVGTGVNSEIPTYAFP